MTTCRTNILMYGWLVSASIECWRYPSKTSYELLAMVKRSIREHRRICQVCQDFDREMTRLEVDDD